MKTLPISTMPFRHSMVLTLSVLVLSACGSLSEQSPEGNGGPPMPTAEALASCKSLSSGKECSFTSPQGTVTGSCWAPEGKPLACKPKNAPTGGSTPSKQ